MLFHVQYSSKSVFCYVRTTVPSKMSSFPSCIKTCNSTASGKAWTLTTSLTSSQNAKCRRSHLPVPSRRFSPNDLCSQHFPFRLKDQQHSPRASLHSYLKNCSSCLLNGSTTPLSVPRVQCARNGLIFAVMITCGEPVPNNSLAAQPLSLDHCDLPFDLFD